MSDDQSGNLFVAPDYQPLLRQIALDAQGVFEDPRIIAWRHLPDRANCTLDADLPDSRHVRLHIKRYPAARSRPNPAEQEARGHQLLLESNIPTAPLVGWGTLADGRSFVIFDDLTGYRPADKLVEKGTPFDLLLKPAADLAARLHNAALHHRDLYLCHFMARVVDDHADIRLIDPARVRRLPGMWTRGRWIVKDLAQFWYSTLRLAVTDHQRRTWLDRYARQRAIDNADRLCRRIEAKVRSIARHDARLHRKRPERDVSIPA